MHKIHKTYSVLFKALKHNWRQRWTQHNSQLVYEHLFPSRVHNTILQLCQSCDNSLSFRCIFSLVFLPIPFVVYTFHPTRCSTRKTTLKMRDYWFVWNCPYFCFVFFFYFFIRFCCWSFVLLYLVVDVADRLPDPIVCRIKIACSPFLFRILHRD